MLTAYNLITAFIAFSGCLALAFTGEINPLVSLSGFGLIPGYYRFMKGYLPAPSWAIGMFSAITLIVFFLDSLLITGDVFLAVAHLTISFQAIKSFDLKEPWDHLQVYFVSLLQLIIVSELTHSIAFGAVFVVFLALLTAAMVLSHFLKEGAAGKVDVRPPIFIISVAALLVSVVLFAALPRFTYRFLGKSHARGIRTVGFSEQVDFGAMGEVKLDDTIIMRVETDAPPPYYWRGLTLDKFDGVSWKNTLMDRSRIPGSGGEATLASHEKNLTRRQTVFLEPIDSDVIFALTEPAILQAGGFAVLRDSAGSLFLYGKTSRSVRYSVYSRLEDFLPSSGRPGRYLQLPEGTGKISALAEDVSRGAASDSEAASMIESYLGKNFSYTLSPPAPNEGETPLESFLFSSKKGYCEHYSSAMAIMLRCLRIPSRIVTGFSGGEKNRYGDYLVVRQSDAHSWVEALIDGKWRRYDPTPASDRPVRSQTSQYIDSLRMAWFRYVVGFSSSDQKSILDFLSSVLFNLGPGIHTADARDIRHFLLIVSGIGTAAVIVYFAVRIRTKRRYGPASAGFIRLRNLLRKKGVKIDPAGTSADVRLKTKDMPQAADIDLFLSSYEEYRFGGRKMDAHEKKKYGELLRRIGKSL